MQRLKSTFTVHHSCDGEVRCGLAGPSSSEIPAMSQLSAGWLWLQTCWGSARGRSIFKRHAWDVCRPWLLTVLGVLCGHPRGKYRLTSWLLMPSSDRSHCRHWGSDLADGRSLSQSPSLPPSLSLKYINIQKHSNNLAETQ